MTDAPDLVARLRTMAGQLVVPYPHMAAYADVMVEAAAALAVCTQERDDLQAKCTEAFDSEVRTAGRIAGLTAARERVAEYLQHHSWCGMKQSSLLWAGEGPQHCTCGFSAVLASPPPETP